TMSRRRAFVSVLVGIAAIFISVETAAGKPRYEVLHGFTMPGMYPDGGSPLVQAADGFFYGTTGAGGKFQGGTIFKISPIGVLTTVHHFDCGDSFGGCQPFGLIH